MKTIKSIITSGSAEDVVKVLKTRFKKVSEKSRLKVLKSLKIVNKKDFSVFVQYRELYPETSVISYIKIGKEKVYTNDEKGALAPGTQMVLNFK